MSISTVLEAAHEFAGSALRPDETAIDATVGNGHDTLALAQAVGREGRVVGFDVQAEAIAATRERLQSASVAAEVELIHEGHQQMADYVEAASVGAITFNLGYLPGSDSTLTTQPETTIPALDAAVERLRPGGVLTVVLYTGHEGGAAEAAAVDDWAADLPQSQYRALSYRFVNQQNDPPRLLAVERRSDTA